MTKQNGLWIPLNEHCPKGKGTEEILDTFLLLYRITPNEKWNVSSRSTHEMKAPDHAGYLTPTKITKCDEEIQHPHTFARLWGKETTH